MQLTCFSSLLIVACGEVGDGAPVGPAPAKGEVPLLIGGLAAKEGQFPAALWMPDPGCSGTGVGEHLILTAAHCVVEYGDHQPIYQFAPGDKLIVTTQLAAHWLDTDIPTPLAIADDQQRTLAAKTGYVLLEVAEVLVGPWYDDGSRWRRDEDVALIRTKERVPTASYAHVQGATVPTGTAIVQTGYGGANYSGNPETDMKGQPLEYRKEGDRYVAYTRLRYLITHAIAFPDISLIDAADLEQTPQQQGAPCVADGACVATPGPALGRLDDKNAQISAAASGDSGSGLYLVETDDIYRTIVGVQSHMVFGKSLYRNVANINGAVSRASRHQVGAWLAKQGVAVSP